MKNKIIKTVFCGLFAAITFLGTMVSVPLPAYGYINIGDCIVLISGAILGPFGFIAAAVGSSLADVALGFAVYAPATFIIKFLVAAVVYFVYSKSGKIVGFLIGSFVAEAVMILGYFSYEWLLYGLPGAIPGILGNSIQAICNILIAFVILLCLNKLGVLKWINSVLKEK